MSKRWYVDRVSIVEETLAWVGDRAIIERQDV